MHDKPFLSPADVARELDVSPSTVLRLIHRGELPAIAVSPRIYRVPRASFELFMTGALREPEPAPVGDVRPRPQLAPDERLPQGTREPLATTR